MNSPVTFKPPPASVQHPLEWYMDNAYWSTAKPRDPQMGPFKVVGNYTAKGQKLRARNTHRVINKEGRRVHRGNERSCIDVCASLNVKYAEWLMVQP